MALVARASREGTSKNLMSFHYFKEHMPLDSGALLIFHVYSETVEVENTDDRWRATSKRTNTVRNRHRKKTLEYMGLMVCVQFVC